MTASLRSRIGLLVALTSLTFALPLLADEKPDAPRAPVKPMLIRIDGEIGPLMEAYLLRQIDRCVGAGSKLLIFQVDSLGGALIESEILSMAIISLEERGVKTVAYVPTKAISGAAFISLSCDEIYMHGRAQIGDAGVIRLAGEAFEKVEPKILSKVLVTLKTIAEAKGRPVGLVQAMSDGNLEVFRVTHRDTQEVNFKTDNEIEEADGLWIKGDLIWETRKGNYFTVDAARAHELLISEAPIESYSDLKEELGIPADVTVEEIRETWMDTFVFFFNTGFGAFLLIALAVICLYLELHFVSGMFGIMSALFFGLFFWSRFLGGTSGWLEVILFAIGIFCIVMEVFVIPGFGVFGVSGGLLVFAALVMSSQRFTGTDSGKIIENVTYDTGIVAGAIATVIGVAVVLNRFLPAIPFFNKMMLQPPEARSFADAVATGGSPGTLGVEPPQVVIGDRGQTVSMLRPAGKAKIDGKTLDVVSIGTFIDAGDEIEVVEVNANRVVVRKPLS